jgi:hypothetical protein
MADFYIATEDRLSEALAEYIVIATGHSVAAKIPKDRRRHGGFGYLKTRLPDFISSCCGGLSFLLLTDLDTRPCPRDILDDWFGMTPKPKGLLLRIAVREVEAWVLADRSRFADWLGISKTEVPHDPESCRDPKADLLHLATKSKKRDLKEGLLPKKGAPSPIGLEYNDLLCNFVNTEWRLDEASRTAPSLARAIRRLQKFDQPELTP